MEPEGGDSMKLGENIRALRLRKRMTQEQVAQKLGVTYQAVSKWENGTNTPDIALLPEIAAFFGVTIDALFHQDAISALDGFPVEDDGVIRIVQLRGRQVLKVTPRMSPDDPAIEIAFPRSCNDRTQYFKVEVYGHVIADGSINGNVVAHQSVQCAEINGDVRSQGDVKAGNINACGNIVCSGNVNAINLTCDQITHGE